MTFNLRTRQTHARGCRVYSRLEVLIGCLIFDYQNWIKALISIAQLRAARALLGWSKARLAHEADLPLPTLKHYEASGSVKVPEYAMAAMRHALEAAGVEFTNGGQPGVRMKAAPTTVPVDQLNASNDE